MTTFAYRTVDVFTEHRFGGNPLAVVPDARGMSDADMQRVAAEFNYSETTFILPPADPANTARVRIFTPKTELPFAGHPNVGSAFLLGRLGAVFDRPASERMRFEEEAGLVEVRLERAAGEVVGAEIRAPGALEIGRPVDPETVAACISLASDAIVTSGHPPIAVSVGLPFVMAELRDTAALAAAVPDRASFAAAAAHRGDGDRFLLFVYTRSPGRSDAVRARMFAPLDDIVEDPATGSASAALGAFLASLRPESDHSGVLEIEQGVEMGRPSLITVRTVKANEVVSKVTVAGRCVEVMRGTIEL